MISYEVLNLSIEKGGNLQGVQKKSLILVLMAISSIKTIRNFQNWWRNHLKKGAWSWQPPSKNGLELIAWDLTHFREGVANFKLIIPLMLKGLVPIMKHLCWIFQNTQTFPFLMDFMAMRTRITLFFWHYYFWLLLEIQYILPYTMYILYNIPDWPSVVLADTPYI